MNKIVEELNKVKKELKILSKDWFYDERFLQILPIIILNLTIENFNVRIKIQIFFVKKFKNKTAPNKPTPTFFIFDLFNISLKVKGISSFLFLVIHGCLIA